jgi:hypothetical protein
VALLYAREGKLQIPRCARDDRQKKPDTSLRSEDLSYMRIDIKAKMGRRVAKVAVGAACCVNA